MKIKQSGFAVLTTVVILSAAGILYTVNMVHSQLIDNQVLGNYYRNNEALANAESGVHLILSKLNTASVADDLLANLPFTYPENTSEIVEYQVNVTKELGNKLQIHSIGYSLDKSALREVSLQVYHQVTFDIPTASLSSNGSLAINSSGVINAGCEGVTKENCRSPSNIAQQITTTAPNSSELNDSACVTDSSQNEEVDASVDNEATGQWGVATSSAGSVFSEITELADMNNANSLFQKTFGITLENAKEYLSNSERVAQIDMTQAYSISCSEQLNELGDDVNIIYIKGDCNIDTSDASFDAGDSSKRFTIGSSEKPKMVFIEGGTFIDLPDTGASINGMLYLLPATRDVVDENGNNVYKEGVIQTKLDQTIDMSGIRVNGALLSEYKCSNNEADTALDNNNKQHFSVRFDKSVLNSVYEKFGMEALTSSYQFVEGSWKDF